MKPARVERLILSSNEEKDVQEVGCAIQRASSHIHKTTLRGGGQFVIVEGKLATNLVKKLPGLVNNHILNSRYQVVFIENGLYKNCITVVKRGEYMRFRLTKPKKIDNGDFPDISIPEIVCVPTMTRSADSVCEIYIEPCPPNVTMEWPKSTFEVYYRKKRGTK